MKVFVISIEEENSPRLNSFLCQPFFQNGNLEYTKFGVKGGELSAKEYFELAVKGRSKPLTPSEVGCTLSHIMALKAFLSTDDDYAIIFEDDAIIPKELNLCLLENSLKKINFPNCILFSLGGIQMKESLKVRGEIIQQKFLGNTVLKVNQHFFNRVNYAVAYIVDRDMASNLIAYHYQLRKADDWSYLYDFNKLSKIYMTYLIDHPEIMEGETNKQLSSIEAERAKFKDLPKSQYGYSLAYSLAKLRYKTYPKSK